MVTGGDRTPAVLRVDGRLAERQADAMTITAFLLARIAEDQAEAEGDLDPAVAARWELINPDWQRLMRKQLAECEAKRRIVEEAPLWGCGKTMAKILAAVYADHPDFDDSWRA